METLRFALIASYTYRQQEPARRYSNDSRASKGLFVTQGYLVGL